MSEGRFVGKLNDRINAICVDYMRTPDDQAEIIEALANALAGSIAITARGDIRKANELFSGAEAYMTEAITDKCGQLKKIVGR